MKMTAILRNSQGSLLFVEPGVDLKTSPPATIWNPNRPEKLPLYLDNYQAAQKWCQWWSMDHVDMEVPDATGDLHARESLDDRPRGRVRGTLIKLKDPKQGVTREEYEAICAALGIEPKPPKVVEK